MTLQQLEYILAVDNERHFARAAARCFVTQATLSMMIQKLEEELEVKIFDRSRQPVVPTEVGLKLLAQARRIVNEAARMKELVAEERGTIAGELRLGIIPTLAPYLLPLFLREFTTQYPAVKLIISDHTTANLVTMLRAGQLDTALLATPLELEDLKEDALFYEKYFLYVSKNEPGFDKQYVLPATIDINHLWLLEEGHCMRGQILNLCELKKQHAPEERLHYDAGSIETLKNMVDRNYGLTILPELSTTTLNAAQRKRLRYFKAPEPVREISLVTHRQYVKSSLLRVLKNTILQAIPEEMKKKEKAQVIPAKAGV